MDRAIEWFVALTSLTVGASHSLFHNADSYVERG